MQIGFEKGISGNCLKERSTNEERKGATKIEPKKQNVNVTSKGVDEGHKITNTELESENTRKKTKEN